MKDCQVRNAINFIDIIKDYSFVNTESSFLINIATKEYFLPLYGDESFSVSECSNTWCDDPTLTIEKWKDFYTISYMR